MTEKCLENIWGTALWFVFLSKQLWSECPHRGCLGSWDRCKCLLEHLWWKRRHRRAPPEALKKPEQVWEEPGKDLRIAHRMYIDLRSSCSKDKYGRLTFSAHHRVLLTPLPQIRFPHSDSYTRWGNKSDMYRDCGQEFLLSYFLVPTIIRISSGHDLCF